MYPAFAKDQLTTRQADMFGTVWSCASKQGRLQSSEPKPFAHRSGRSFGLSICANVAMGTAARLGNPEDQH